MLNEYLALELSKEKRAEAEREAAMDRLAASVASPNRAARVAMLVVLALGVALLVLMV